MALKVHKIALNPNNKQSTLFAQHCGYARLAYNNALDEFKNGLNNSNWLSLPDTKRLFNSKKFEVYEWAKQLSQNASKNAIHDLYDAINRWKSGQNRFPKFKRKDKSLSYRASNGKNTVKVEDKIIHLPKIGAVRMFESLRWIGDIVRVTISKKAHRWLASILIETEDKVVAQNNNSVGIDVGINSLATIDDGTKYENPKALYKYQRKMRRLQRKFSRCQKYSCNWYKLKFKIARLHYRISCIREDAHHKASSAIIKKASIVGIESLNVKGMLKNHKLARALSDASLSNFLTLISYKASKVFEADRFFPSSKTCSNCGSIKSDLKLSDRTYHCNECGYTQDRDVNAAINLKNFAMSCMENQNA